MNEPSQLLLTACLSQIFNKYKSYYWSINLITKLSDLFSINIQVWYYYNRFNKYVNKDTTLIKTATSSIELDKWSVKLTNLYNCLLTVSINDIYNQNLK